MATYQAFTTARATVPDPVVLLANVRTAIADATAGVGSLQTGGYIVKKATAWLPADISAAQSAIDNAPALTAQRAAQNEIDAWPLAQKALVLALIDQLNVIRSKLSPPLSDITPAQALAAVRAKAGTL